MVQEILNQYRLLLEDIDRETNDIYQRFSEIPCKNKCFDCCKQLFPISFVEAYYLSEGIKKLDRKLRREHERKASKITQSIAERNPLRFEKHGIDKKTALGTHREFAEFLHTIESDCPALKPANPNGACTVYPFRNHDCRTMGASVDSSENAIVGCFRFSSLKYLAPKLLDYYYRYPDKMVLDRKLLQTVTGGLFSENVLYYTTMCKPFLKDYQKEDWIAFFGKKGIPSIEETTENYWVVIDI